MAEATIKEQTAQITGVFVCLCVCVFGKLRCEGGKVSCQPSMEYRNLSFLYRNPLCITCMYSVHSS